MISVPCIFPSMSAIAIALTNIPVMIHTISIISMPIFLVVLLWHSTWWSWSLLPYVYAQINADSDHYEPKCYVWTHTSTYGCVGRFWGTCIQWQKMGRTKFRCPWYFINHLVILYHQPTGDSENFFKLRMVCHLFDCAVSPWLCPPCDCVPRWPTLTHLAHYVIPYPLYDHISPHHHLCVGPEAEAGKGLTRPDPAQIQRLVSNGKVW